MGTFIRIYDIDKQTSFISEAKNCLQQLSLINNKCKQLEIMYSEMSFPDKNFYNAKNYLDTITEILENSKSSITDVYTYAAMANNDTYIKLNHLNTKLDMINLELKPLTEITKPECNFNDKNFVNFITPDEVLQNEIISKRLEYYSIGVNWRFILQKDPSEISQEEYEFLAVKYLDNMNTIEMNIFLESQLKYIDKNVDIKYGYMDKEKSYYINEYTKGILEKDLLKLSEFKDRSSDDYLEQKEIVASHMQKAVLLNSIYSVDKFYDFGAIVKIEKPGDDYIFHYYDNTLGDCTDGTNSGCRAREIRVSENLYKDDARDKETDKLEEKIQAKYNKAFSEVALEELLSINPEDKLVGKSDDGIKALTKNKYIGKYGGIVIGKGYDACKKYFENKEILRSFTKTVKDIKLTDYYDWFGLNVINCERYENNDYGNPVLLNREVFIRQSPLTYEVIDRFNKKELAIKMNGGNKITLSDVIDNPDKMRKILNAIKSFKDSNGKKIGKSTFEYITTGA